MKKRLFIPTLLVGTLLVTGSAFAWSGGHNNRNFDGFQNQRGQGITYAQHKDNMGNQLERMGVILDLTDQQKEQLEDLFEKQWQNRQSMRTDMQVSREDLREYKQGKEFNETEFRAKAQKHADFKTEMMVQRAKTKQQIFAILTPEQQQKAENLRELRGEGFRGRHGGDRECNGHGNRNGKGYKQRYNN